MTTVPAKPAKKIIAKIAVGQALDDNRGCICVEERATGDKRFIVFIDGGVLPRSVEESPFTHRETALLFAARVAEQIIDDSGL